MADPDDLEDEVDEGIETEEADGDVEKTEADDAPEQDEEQADSEEGDEEVVAKPSRAESRFQKLANTAREATERASKVEREFNEFKAQQSRAAAQVQEKEPTEDDMALWSTQQVIDYKLQKATGTMSRQLQQMQWNTQEMNDKAIYDRLKLSDPRAERYADEVEARLVTIRAAGQNVDRESLLKFVVGEKVMKGSGKAATKQKKAGAAEIRRQTTKAPTGGSDVRGGRDKDSEAEARRKRLENIVF